MENRQKKKKKTLTRRAFMQSLGGGAVGVGVASRVLGKEPLFQAGPGEMEVFEKKSITLAVNGKTLSLEIRPRETLLEVLRNRLRLTGAKRSCNRGECGGCTVLLDGKPVYSCHLLAAQADGKSILTVEGLASEGKLHPVQQAFIDKDAYQCGFCTPGFLMASVALLNKTKKPSAEEIKAGQAGNICRCGNFQKIYEATAAAAETMGRG
jgi:xanthine dehydrogenase YagT iron-sulfur-binding subunit